MKAASLMLNFVGYINQDNTFIAWVELSKLSCMALLGNATIPFVPQSTSLPWMTLRKYLRNGALGSYAECQDIAGFIYQEMALYLGLFFLYFLCSFLFLFISFFLFLITLLMCTTVLYE